MDPKDGEFPRPVDSTWYFRKEYNDRTRFMSYAQQLAELWALEPRKVLEIGVGSGVISYVLRNAGIDLTTLDVDEALEPDIVASAEHIPLSDGQFDVVACFEVLEHLPFQKFGGCIQELYRVTNRHVLISLPDATPFCSFSIPRIGIRAGCLVFSLPFVRPRKKCLCWEHRWEIGVEGYPMRRVTDAIRSAGLQIARHYRIWDNPYHRIFVLVK